MAEGKDAIAAELGPTLPNLDTVITFLSHLISQINNSSNGIYGSGYVIGHIRRGHSDCVGGGGCGRGGGHGGGGGGGHSGGGGRINVDACNYTSEEWENLLDDQKDSGEAECFYSLIQCWITWN